MQVKPCVKLEVLVAGPIENNVFIVEGPGATFVVDPTVAALLKQKPRLTYGNRAVMDDGMVDDAPTFITNNLVAAASTYNALACADFTRLHVGTWGDLLDITVDPYTRAAYGEIVLTLNYYCDWGWDAANGTAYAVRKLTAA